jgi:GPH family glycoside/pentoside/hexuronide:cation symporter
MLKMIASNVPFLQVTAGIALFYFANVVIYTSLAYFIQYFMGEDQKVTGNVVGMIPFVQMIAIMPWTVASRYLGKRWAWISGLVLATAGLLGLYLVDQPSMPMVYFLIGSCLKPASIGVNLWSIVPIRRPW